MWQLEAPFWAWAVVSVLLGLGFTFFSGAVEAWLVDALHFTGYDGPLEPVFARGQMVEGVAMLAARCSAASSRRSPTSACRSSCAAHCSASRSCVALLMMHDLGFNPVRGERPGPEMKRILHRLAATTGSAGTRRCAG